MSNKARNDHQKRFFHYGGSPALTVETIYAGGERGPDIRADGGGNFMARGYYARVAQTDPFQGPFTTRRKAVTAIRQKGA